MATLAHCAFCFETLSAALEKRQPLDLAQLTRLWLAYNDPLDDDDNDDVDADEQDQEGGLLPPKPAAISRILSPALSSSSSPSSAISTPSSSSTAAPSNSSSHTSLSTLSRPASEHLRPRPGRQAVPSTDPEHAPLFVTWNTIDRVGRKSLRGCIGTFSEQPLERGLRDYALTSAFDDVRFHPIALRELSNLEVAVTLLTDFEPAADPMDWELGKHGIRLSFTYHGRRYGSTYLPDVAREQGWTKEETLVSLMRKAGWSGRKTEWREVANMEVIRYQGKAIQLGHSEWRQWRDWVSSQGYGKQHLN